MNDTTLALIVDPDPTHRELMECMLEDEMDLILASDAQECLSYIENKAPSIIVMERLLPDMNGYLLCKELKENMGTQGCPIMILTGPADFDDKMEGYRHGCDDFISKPFQPEELITRINLSIQAYSIKRDLQKRYSESSEAAMAAMKLGGELGAILRFTEDCAEISDYALLSEGFTKAVQGLGVDCCLMLNTFHGHQFFGCEDGSPEEQVLAMCADKGRFVSLRDKIVINHEKVSVLVMNMPIDNSDRYCELKDSLNIIVNVLQSRAKAIDNEQELIMRRSGGMDEAVKNSKEKMVLIKGNIAQHSEDMNGIMARLNDEMRNACISMALTEEQENTILDMIDGSISALDDSLGRLNDIEIHFSSVVNELTNLIDSG